MMELVRVSEVVSRNYDGGAPEEEVTGIGYNLVEGGAVIGSASVSYEGFYLNARIPGTVKEIGSALEALFGGAALPSKDVPGDAGTGGS